MIILLFTLLAIALTITIAGVMLSPRMPVASQRRGGYVAMRGGTSSIPAIGTGRVRSRRLAEGYARDTRDAGLRTRRLLAGSGGLRRRVPLRHSSLVMNGRAWSQVASSLNIFRLFKPHSLSQTPWLGILLVLICVFVCGVYSLNTLLPNNGLVMNADWISTLTQAPAIKPKPTVSTSSMMLSFAGASRSLERISQVDPAQYASMDEYNTWWPSACSAASMTEVINAYTGRHYRITDILKVESSLGEITPDQGLLENVGIDRTLARFGFKTTWLKSPSLDDVIAIANSGHPVIVDFPPNLWDGGHILVVRGGNKDSVYLADSSRLNMQVMARSKFMGYWAGAAAVATLNQ